MKEYSELEKASAERLIEINDSLFQEKSNWDALLAELERMFSNIPSNMNDTSLSSLILTQDVHDEAKKEYNNGYPCLKKVSRGNYEFIGFLNTNC